MQLFGKTKGAVTVMVVLILIPTVFFTSFLSDLARLKLSGNQAVMAADTYGEAILTYYDNALKELYGLFAVTQSEEGKKKLDELDDVVKASFLPNSSTVGSLFSLDALNNTSSPVLSNVSYSGFMPYADNNPEFRYEPVYNSSLQNPVILSTQISDYMRYRVFSQLADSNLLDVIDQVSQQRKNMEVIKSKSELDEEIESFLELVQEYYRILKELEVYPDYADNVWSWYAYLTGETKTTNNSIINKALDSLKMKTDSFKNSSNSEGLLFALYKEVYKECKKYYLYKDTAFDFFYDAMFNEENSVEIEHKDEYNSFVAFWYKNEELTEQFRVPLSDENEFVKGLKEWIQSNEEYIRFGNLKNEFKFEKSFLIENIKNISLSFNQMVNNISYPIGTVTFSNYEEKAKALNNNWKEILEKKNSIETKKRALDIKLNEEGVNPSLKINMENELKELNDLFEHINDFESVTKLFYDRISNNDNAKKQLEKMMDSVNRTSDKMTGCSISEDLDQTGFKKAIECAENFPSKYIYDIYNGLEQYKNFIDFMDSSFDEKLSNEKTKADEQNKDSEDRKKSAEKGVNEDEYEENLLLRDFPKRDNNPLNEYKYSLASLFDLIDGLSIDKLGQFGNDVLVKFNNCEYAFGMFSSRTTNVQKVNDNTATNDDNELQQPKESLTGYKMSRSTNYLYRSEIEYLLAGNQKSSDNLDYARNRILAFRAMMNFGSTYSIKEINDAINTLGSLFSGFPFLRVAVVVVARTAVTAIETYGDWERLKKAEKVPVFKTKLAHLTSYKTLADWLNLEKKEDGEPFGLDYENYLLIMLMFFTSDNELYQRMGELIELNVNTVICEIGSEGNLCYSEGNNNDKEIQFKMADAYTAVNTACSVQMNYMVIPDGFVKKILEEEAVEQVEQFEKNRYNFTITRGY